MKWHRSTVLSTDVSNRRKSIGFDADPAVPVVALNWSPSTVHPDPVRNFTTT